MRLIDAERLRAFQFDRNKYARATKREIDDLDKSPEGIYMKGWNCAVDAIIEHAPTIDAVEVVRCKDCKFGVYEKGRGIYHIRCEILEFLFQDDDYCSYGERRNNGELD